MPRGLIQGAVFCCNNSDYNSGLPGYTKKYAGRGLLTSISYHHYSIGGCDGKSAALWKLMSNDPFVLTAAYMQPFVTAAQEAGIFFRIGEGNTVSCGGAPGVSDVFAAALFSLDVMMETSAIGINQWNCECFCLLATFLICPHRTQAAAFPRPAHHTLPHTSTHTHTHTHTHTLPQGTAGRARTTPQFRLQSHPRPPGPRMCARSSTGCGPLRKPQRAIAA
jgi:hypothetical protein